MKQTAVEQIGIAFRQWQKDWDNFDKTGKNKPISYDEFIKPFLEIEKQQIINAWIVADNELQMIAAEKYYKETYK